MQSVPTYPLLGIEKQVFSFDDVLVQSHDGKLLMLKHYRSSEKLQQLAVILEGDMAGFRSVAIRLIGGDGRINNRKKKSKKLMELSLKMVFPVQRVWLA
ncbi:hypothetical protein Q3G72_026878 [Acer saccharum]|nr:hypothetical protein Q3G72_026878 [Acer saccharum]